VQGFVEVRVDERDGITQRRRFTVASPPARDAGRFEWTVEIEKQDEDRSRAGAVPSGV
jgi:NAD(P)H-flavin reductase